MNSVVHGVSDAGVEIQHYLTCDGFNAMLASQYGFLSLRNWRIWGDASQGGDVLRGRYQGNYGAQAALEGWLTDSTNVIEQVLVDGAFELSNGTVVDGLDPRASSTGTVNPYYVPTDERLEPAVFHGALDPEAPMWFEGWSTLAGMGLVASSSEEDGNGEGCTYAMACNFDSAATKTTAHVNSPRVRVHVRVGVQLRRLSDAGRRLVRARNVWRMHLRVGVQLRPCCNARRRVLHLRGMPGLHFPGLNQLQSVCLD